MLEIPEYDIRYSEMGDIDFLYKCFLDPSASEPFPFSFEEREIALLNWIGFSRFKASLTGTIGGVPVAVGTLFLMPYRKVAHHCSFYLIVDPEHRKRGIGTSMVRNLVHLAKTRFRLESLHAELSAPSPLEGVLQKLGFEEFARQEGFVKLNGELRARVLMEHFF